MGNIREEIDRVKQIMGLSLLKEVTQSKNLLAESIIGNMKNNVSSDYYAEYETITFCNFLKYWEKRYNRYYDGNHFNTYDKSVKKAFEDHETSKVDLKLISAVAYAESGGIADNRGNPTCYGLFQYCRKYMHTYGINSREDAENPDIATRQFVKHITRLGDNLSTYTGKDVFAPEHQYLLYLSWQQGAAGIRNIIDGCDTEGSDNKNKKSTDVQIYDKVDVVQVDDILSGDATIKRGDMGDIVKYVQSVLVFDYNVDLGDFGELKDGVDGKFGSKTAEGVKLFQEDYGLVMDGIVGPCTLDTMLEGSVHSCCKPNGCKNSTCKDSKWCKRSKNKKKPTKPNIKKDNKKNYSDIEDIIPKAPCSSLQLDKIPNAPNSWRSGQPTAEELVWIIETYDIKHIVRMNGDSKSDKSAKCGGSLTTKEEEEIAEYYGVTWYGNTKHTSGGSFYSSHGKGKPGKGRNITGGSVPPIVDLIGEGNVLVHCRNGADRTGQMVGAFLSQYWSNPEDLWDYAIKFNNWGGPSGHICEPGGNWGYIKYMEAFYPLRDWCQADENRSSCSSCKNVDKIDKVY